MCCHDLQEFCGRDGYISSSELRLALLKLGLPCTPEWVLFLFASQRQRVEERREGVQILCPTNWPDGKLSLAQISCCAA